MKILITGANGFVGKPIATYLHQKGYNVLGLIRKKTNSLSFPTHEFSDLSQVHQWKGLLSPDDIVLHLAARAHQVNEKKNQNTQKLYLETNFQLTQKIADACVQSNIKHFIFMSSIAAYPFDPDIPQTKKNQELQKRWHFYGESKWLAENYLRQLQQKSSLKVSIIRPPLIYGPEVKGNMQTLISLCQKGYPLPFGRITAKKSMISIDNLQDLLHHFLEAPSLWGETYFIKDFDLTPREIITEIQISSNKKKRIVNMPKFLLTFLSKLIRQEEKIKRFTEELIIDDSKIRQKLKWSPPFSYKECFQKMIISCISK